MYIYYISICISIIIVSSFLQSAIDKRLTRVEDAILSLTKLFHPQSTPPTTNSGLPTSNSTPAVGFAKRRVSLTSQMDEVVYQIPEVILKEALLGCRSRRNLAGRLTDCLFTLEEKQTSNFRGVLKKERLDMKKTEAIRRACLSSYPPLQHEPPHAFERDIREGVDEMCRRCSRKSREAITYVLS